jgi:uncharacterized membrane protein
MIKVLQFTSYFFATLIFVVGLSVLVLATKPFVSVQYLILPNSPDQKALAQESLNILTSFKDSERVAELFTSLKHPNQSPLYTSLEVDHLVDVKMRFDALRYATIISFILLLIQSFAFKRRVFTQLTYYASLLGLVVIVAIGGLLALSWNWLFVTFHEVLFPAGNWSFSPDSGLIQLFPEIFWFRFGLTWVGMILLLLLTSTLISKRILNRTSSN